MERNDYTRDKWWFTNWRPCPQYRYLLQTSYSHTQYTHSIVLAWSYLVDSENNDFKFVKLHKENTEIAIIYADPRRMTDEFKEMIDQVLI